MIEPNPQAIDILRVNIALNGLDRLVDLTHLGVGLSDTPAKARPHSVPKQLRRNKLLAVDETAGTLRLVPGDDLLMHRRVDFIKIDVEQMEMSVLAGLSGTIAKWRPNIFVGEVTNRNRAELEEWLQNNGYVVSRTFCRYQTSQNYMVVPVRGVVKRTCGPTFANKRDEGICRRSG